ncbi:MAG: hypothetical protein E6Q97_38945 [Desulfurellales bacterium]|nr:MAG: hypothetical protein E6Q97_38945 [Desulfurellales bacterium]
MSNPELSEFNGAMRQVLEAVAHLGDTQQVTVLCAALCQDARRLGLSREQVLAGVSGTYAIIHAQELIRELTASQTGLTQ